MNNGFDAGVTERIERRLTKCRPFKQRQSDFKLQHANFLTSFTELR